MVALFNPESKCPIYRGILNENFVLTGKPCRGLAIVGRAVATRATLPVTQNVLLSVEKSMLKLSATNLEIAITTNV